MPDASWKEQLRSRITDFRGLADRFDLSAEESAFFTKHADVAGFRFQVTPYYLDRAVKDDPRDPVRLQVVPREDELIVKEYETGDPLCEKKFEPVPFLVHRYRNRALVRVTAHCAVSCRFCFRRSLLGGPVATIDGEGIGRIAEYLASRTEISELLLSGGDPLVLDDELVEEIIVRVRSVRPDIVLRVCTRTPVVLPQRITDKLVSLFSRYAPVWVVTHFNHPNELAEESIGALRSLVRGGVPVLNQTVLLRDINDDASTLAVLFTGLVATGVRPYYLFQGDLAAGTSHFRVPIGRGLAIHHGLSGLVSGIALPVYAVDLPEGGGKVPIRSPYYHGKDRGWHRFTGPEGGSFAYPDET